MCYKISVNLYMDVFYILTYTFIGSLYGFT